jgi:hypothetical protein
MVTQRIQGLVVLEPGSMVPVEESCIQRIRIANVRRLRIPVTTGFLVMTDRPAAAVGGIGVSVSAFPLRNHCVSYGHGQAI